MSFKPEVVADSSGIGTLAALRIDLVGTTADSRRFCPRHPLPINHLLCENRETEGRIGEVRLEPVVARYRSIAKRLYFRADAAFANPEIYEFLEGEGIGYTVRLPANRGRCSQEILSLIARQRALPAPA
jgi:hypothetical protein